jgi:hypothetical protein
LTLASDVAFRRAFAVGIDADRRPDNLNAFAARRSVGGTNSQFQQFVSIDFGFEGEKNATIAHLWRGARAPDP